MRNIQERNEHSRSHARLPLSNIRVEPLNQIPTLNIMCPVRYSNICMKICKLFFDLFGCICAQTPPVFGCSCITYKNEITQRYTFSHLHQSLNSDVIELHIPVKCQDESIVQRLVQVIRARGRMKLEHSGLILAPGRESRMSEKIEEVHALAPSLLVSYHSLLFEVAVKD